MEAANDSLKMFATDLETGIFTNIPVTVLEEGTVVLPARYLVEIVRRLPEAQVEMEYEKSKGGATIRCARFHTSLQSFAPEEFPYFNIPENGFNFNIEPGTFLEALHDILFAISGDESRAIFTGALFELGKETLTFTSTDIHRLAIKRISIPELQGQVTHQARQIIVPGKTLSELNRIIAADEGELNISISPNQIFFKYDNITIFTRLIEGQFPNYEQIIPPLDSCVASARLNARDLLLAVERIAVIAREKTSIIAITMAQESDQLELHTITEIGEAQEQVPAQISGNMQICFNSRLLSDTLKVMENKEIELNFEGSSSPCIIRRTGEENYVALVLPIQKE